MGEKEEIDHRYAGAIEQGWEQLERVDPKDLAELSGGTLSDKILELDILNRRARIDLDANEIKWSDGEDLPDDLKVLLLHYLLRAEGKIDGSWKSYREIEGGDLYYSVFQGRAILPLTSIFGENLDALVKASESLGGEKKGRGDASFDFKFFPYLLINVTLWEGDEEVPPSMNILFDTAAGRVLPTEDLAHLSAELVHLLKNASE